jgi:Family of unknown function (DUF5681)
MAFVKGKSGNPLGRPTGSRNKLVESFVTDLQTKWQAEGTAILDRLAISSPEKIVEAISRLAPKDLAVTVNERNSLGVDPVLWSGFQRVLAAIEECAPADANPVDVFDSLEQMVRAHFAKAITGN